MVLFSRVGDCPLCRWEILLRKTKTSYLYVGVYAYGENLIARCSQVHDNFTMGVNRKILINLIYLFIQETYLTCANGSDYLLFTHYRYVFFKFLV